MNEFPRFDLTGQVAVVTAEAADTWANSLPLPAESERQLVLRNVPNHVTENFIHK